MYCQPATLHQTEGYIEMLPCKSRLLSCGVPNRTRSTQTRLSRSYHRSFCQTVVRASQMTCSRQSVASHGIAQRAEAKEEGEVEEVVAVAEVAAAADLKALVDQRQDHRHQRWRAFSTAV